MLIEAFFKERFLHDGDVVILCVDDSFKTSGDTTSDNSILKEDQYWQNLMRVMYYPSITINNQTYQGDFDGYDVSVALCASFKERPDICRNQMFEVMKGQDLVFSGVNLKYPIRKLMIVGLFIVFANVMIVCVHKRYNAK
jgi:hypothetical protein